MFRFSDAGHFDLDAMVVAGESIRPSCPAPASVAAAPGPAPLSPGELAAEIPGHTFTIGGQRLFFAAGGRLVGSIGADEGDLGTWEIRDGRVCRPCSGVIAGPDESRVGPICSSARFSLCPGRAAKIVGRGLSALKIERLAWMV